MPIDPDLVKQLAAALTDDPDILDETVLGNLSKQVKGHPKTAPKGRSVMTESVSGAIYNCRNTIYRRGTTMFCGRPSVGRHCVECKDARDSISEYVMGDKRYLHEEKCQSCGTSRNPRKSCRNCGAKAVSESAQKKSSKKKSNTPDTEKFDDKFEVHDDYEDRKEPAAPGKQKRKSSLQDGPDGAKQPKGKPYLEASARAEAAAQRLRDSGLGLDQKAPTTSRRKASPRATKKKADAEAAAQRLRDSGLGLD